MSDDVVIHYASDSGMHGYYTEGPGSDGFGEDSTATVPAALFAAYRDATAAAERAERAIDRHIEGVEPDPPVPAPDTFELTVVNVNGCSMVPLDTLLMLMASMEVTAEAEGMPGVASVFKSLGTQIAGAQP
jgi:predicted RNase H-like HicB family nuclease